MDGSADIKDTSFKIAKNAGLGTTHKIRNQLNFTDPKKWKKFSSRRLELIDKFGLSERKASEQDETIKQIANILRTEFEFPITSAAEFEKLVTAAVQSVRRNRKRSKKKFDRSPVNCNSSASSSVSSPKMRPSMSNLSNLLSPSYSSAVSSASSEDEHEDIPIPYNNSNRTVSQLLSPPELDQDNSNNIVSLPIVANTLKPFSLLNETNPQYNIPQQPILLNKPQVNDPHEKVKSMLKDLINIKLPLSEYSNSISNSIISNQLKENLLTNIQKSRSFLSVVEIVNESNFQNYLNLENLGQTSISTSISFVIETYFTNILRASFLDILKVKSSSAEYITNITEELFNRLVVETTAETNDIVMVSKDLKIKTMNLLVGAVVKDFGFNSVLYPLNEIIQQLIKAEYEQIENASSNGTNKNHFNGLNILSAVSMQVNDDTSPQVKSEGTQEKEQLPSVALFDNIIKKMSTNSQTLINSGSRNILPKPTLMIKKTFENGNLPTPIHQIL